MFAVRGFAVSLSIFVLVYSALSLAVCGVWRRVWGWACARQHSQKECADLLLALRMLPLVMAVGVTLILAVPSFLELEPRAVREPLGGMPLVLSICGIGVILAGIWNAAAALTRASRVIAQWSREGSVISLTAVGSKGSVSVRQSSGPVPPLTTAGIVRPTVWLSRGAEFVLTQRELQGALRHEEAHVRRRDNLRKLMLRVVAFPGMAALEFAWRETSEMAADDAAVSSVSEALDLAAAVIKLSRLASLQPSAELTTALVHSPAESVNTRVERLIAWKDRRLKPSGYSVGYAVCAAAGAVAVLAVTYSALLVRMHAATEWLVR